MVCVTLILWIVHEYVHLAAISANTLNVLFSAIVSDVGLLVIAYVLKKELE